MRVLVGGGTGFIGKRLVSVLKTKGHDVTIISRTSGNGKISWDDLRKTSKLPPCEVVVNLAGENVMNPFRRWNDDYKRDATESRIGTNRLLIECMKNAETPPSVWMSSSAIGYYPFSTTEEFTETYVNTPKTWMEQLCYDWEASAELPDTLKDKVRTSIFRIGIVCGKEGGVIQNSIWKFWLGLGGKMGSGQQYFPWIHIDDMVGMFIHAMENEKFVGILNGVAPEIITNSEFTNAFASALWRPALFPVPEFLLSLVFGEERKDVVTKGMKVIPQRVLDLGYKFQFPAIRPALVDIVSSK